MSVCGGGGPTTLLPLEVGAGSVELIEEVQRITLYFNVGEQGHEAPFELLVELHITEEGVAH